MSNNPSVNPANQDSLSGVLQFVYKKFLQDTDGMLPAQVISASSDRKTVTVKALIAVKTTDGSIVSRAQISEIPVFKFGGGGFFISFPLTAGSLGWIQANDRDISLFLQSYSDQPPNTNRLHSFSDAVFFPDIMTGYEIAGEDADHAVIQNLDGTVRISLWEDRVKITSPLLLVDGAITATGIITAENGVTTGGGGGTPFVVNGNMTLTGNIRVNGNITASGDITPHVP